MPPVVSRPVLPVAADLMSASLPVARRTLPNRSTPCSDWQLGHLVHHVADSASTDPGHHRCGAYPDDHDRLHPRRTVARRASAGRIQRAGQRRGRRPDVADPERWS
jgi:hypothetical protein